MGNAMNEFWFKPKTFGYGATPSTWQGWAFLALYFAIIAVISAALVGQQSSVSAWVAWAAVVIMITIAASWMMRRKTDGPWRWRWGRTNSGKAI
jgi:hypothetical protein